jgi:pimeloyl-ACP methyl ester carboxylesterase
MRSQGSGRPVLLIHGTGTDSTCFERPAGELAGEMRVLTYDRTGWGETEAIGDYRRTSIAEQAIEAAGLLHRTDPAPDEPVTVLGVGFGAVVALELALAEPELVSRAILVEPPLFGLLTEATEGVSTDTEAIRAAVERGGESAAYGLYLSGGLPTLGAGAERLGETADRRPAAARSLLIELPAVPAWTIDPARLAGLSPGVTVVTLPSSPAILADAADALLPRIPRAERLVTSTGEIDGSIIELLGADALPD